MAVFLVPENKGKKSWGYSWGYKNQKLGLQKSEKTPSFGWVYCPKNRNYAQKTGITPPIMPFCVGVVFG
jgi:hypothetical protein